jgi:signal transduction histidine kinase
MGTDDIQKKATSRLVASISHEIISPVSNISGFARLLGSDPQVVLDERTRDLLQRIRRNSVRLAHLVEEAGVLARLHWEIETPSREEFDLRVVIEGALKDTAEVVGTGEAGPVLELPDGELRMTGDQKRLRIAIGGLLLNLAKDLGTRRMAIKAEARGKSWEITAWHAATAGEAFSFAEMEAEGGGPSAVLILELLRSLGCLTKLLVSAEGARKIVLITP